MSQTEKNTINLGDYQTPAAKTITGRPWGKKVREDSRIDQIESESEFVYVVIPEGLKTIGPSFFEELFVNVIRKLGRTEFRKKVQFVNLGTYEFETSLSEAIDRVLRKSTALG